MENRDVVIALELTVKGDAFLQAYNDSNVGGSKTDDVEIAVETLNEIMRVEDCSLNDTLQEIKEMYAESKGIDINDPSLEQFINLEAIVLTMK